MADNPTYPANDLNQGQLLLAQLGSFWANIFQDSDKLQAHLRSSAQEQAQTYLQYLETVACVSRLTVPVFHRRYWTVLTFKESDLATVPSVYSDNDLVYGPQPLGSSTREAGFVQQYGARDNDTIVELPLPGELKNCPWTIQTSPIKPSQVWVSGTGYSIDTERDLLVMRDNPFNDPKVPVRDIIDPTTGLIVDREIALWVYLGEYDLDYVYIQFGYALNIKLKSSQEYKDLLNAIWDAVVLGPSKQSFATVMAAVAGTPTILDPEETVEVIQAEVDTYLIVTNSHVYRVPLTAGLSVEVGETYNVGHMLTDAVTIQEISGANPDYSLLPSISMGPEFLEGPYYYGLTFRNASVALEYKGLSDQGKAIVQFEVSGFPGDVERFWTDVQARGEAAGATLAELLDTRTVKEGQPGPGAFPATINPLQFIISNLMRNNLFLIRLKQASFGSDALGVEVTSFLRGVVPPHTTYLIFVEIAPMSDSANISLPGSETQLGAEEDVGLSVGPGIFAEQWWESTGGVPANGASYGDAFVLVRQVSLNCQA